jgi:Photosynthetic reaction centre cytochrome C subunit
MRRVLAVALLALGAAVGLSAQAPAPVDARMAAWSKALGVQCVHCHVADDWTNASRPTFEFAQRMNRMVDALNAGPLKNVAAVDCWTCHRGQPIPPRLARDAWEKIRAEHAAEFADRPNRAIAMSVYAASLGVDCSHCHDSDRALNTKPGKAIVREKMLPIFEEIPTHFSKERMPTTQCFMCHQGRVKPERAEGRD